jgi:hypothetical protein
MQANDIDRVVSPGRQEAVISRHSYPQDALTNLSPVLYIDHQASAVIAIAPTKIDLKVFIIARYS